MNRNGQIFTNHWTSIFYNPLYLIRSALYEEICIRSGYLKGRLLDFGCGTKPYKHLFNNVEEYIGLDFESDRVKGEKTETDIIYDGKTIPADDNSFDSILSTEVFEHLFDLQGALKELNRVLKPGGLMLFTCPFSFGEHESPYDFARYTSFALKSILQSNGFEIVEYKKTGSHIAVIIQYIALYINYIISKSKPIKIILFPILISPLFFMSKLLHFALPIKFLRDDLYLNNIVLCKKINK
ncbi:MAG: class I SAM-dependent methyltransferase [Bacteroidota bacterium]